MLSSTRCENELFTKLIALNPLTSHKLREFVNYDS